MAYVGPEPKVGQNREMDDISSNFDGNRTAFTIQVGGADGISLSSGLNSFISLPLGSTGPLCSLGS